MLASMTDKPKRGRPKGNNRKVVAFQLRLPPDLNAALEACLAQTRRVKNTEVVLALEEYLKKGGFWPPPDKSPPEGS